MNKEEIAQWVIDNRYPKSENNKMSDSEMYYTLIEKIEAAISVTRCCEELRENNKPIDGGTSYATLGKTKGKSDM
jgi:hypothetical protein